MGYHVQFTHAVVRVTMIWSLWWGSHHDLVIVTRGCHDLVTVTRDHHDLVTVMRGSPWFGHCEEGSPWSGYCDKGSPWCSHRDEGFTMIWSLWKGVTMIWSLCQGVTMIYSGNITTRLCGFFYWYDFTSQCCFQMWLKTLCGWTQFKHQLTEPTGSLNPPLCPKFAPVKPQGKGEEGWIWLGHSEEDRLSNKTD